MQSQKQKEKDNKKGYSAHKGRLQKHYNQIFDVRIDEDFKNLGK